MHLFISYAHDDKALVEESIVSLLRAAGHDPWYDYHLLPGMDWQAELLNVITTCDALVYVMTPASVQSEWCRWEVAKAIELEKPVVPVLLLAAKLPRSMRSIQYVDFTQGATGEAAARLVGGLQKLSLQQAPAAPVNPAGAPTHVVQPRAGWQSQVKRIGARPIALIMVLVIVVLIGWWIGPLGGDSDQASTPRTPEPTANEMPTATPTTQPGDLYLERSAEAVAVCATRALDLSALKLDFRLNTRYTLGDVFAGSATTQAGQCWCLQTCSPADCSAPTLSSCAGDNTRVEDSSIEWRSRDIQVSMGGTALGTCRAQVDNPDVYRCDFTLENP